MSLIYHKFLNKTEIRRILIVCQKEDSETITDEVQSYKKL